MASAEELIAVFQDTIAWCRNDRALAVAVHGTQGKTVVYPEGVHPRRASGKPYPHMCIEVTGEKTFEAAFRIAKLENPGKIAVLNFASATNPGGGVTRGSRAQEESLCRCSTLYPVLSQGRLMRDFYQHHRDRRDVLYTDRCIYSPDIVVCKTDDDIPQRLPPEEWLTLDVITCAAPNLRHNPYNRMNPGSGTPAKISDDDLLKLHISRARHILAVAAANDVNILILGASGCGAFRNDPWVVARAYQTALQAFQGQFASVVFAVYCSPNETENFRAFSSVFGAKP